MVHARSDFRGSVVSLLGVVSSDRGAQHTFSKGRSLAAIAQRWSFRYTCSSPIITAWVDHSLQLVKSCCVIYLLSTILRDCVGTEHSVGFCRKDCCCRCCSEHVSGECCPHLGNGHCRCIWMNLNYAAGVDLDAHGM